LANGARRALRNTSTTARILWATRVSLAARAGEGHGNGQGSGRCSRLRVGCFSDGRVSGGRMGDKAHRKRHLRRNSGRHHQSGQRRRQRSLAQHHGRRLLLLLRGRSWLCQRLHAQRRVARLGRDSVSAAQGRRGRGRGGERKHAADVSPAPRRHDRVSVDITEPGWTSVTPMRLASERRCQRADEENRGCEQCPGSSRIDELSTSHMLGVQDTAPTACVRAYLRLLTPPLRSVVGEFFVAAGDSGERARPIHT